jgi:hypothetical protein
MASIGSSIGSIIGGIGGTAVGGPLGTAVGSALGAAAGQAITAIPALIKTDAEKENERRLKELKRQQEMGTLGLTEAEKQQLYTVQQGQAAGQMRQAEAQIRAAGAALGGSGAGTEALRQAQLAEGMVATEANIARDVEGKNLERKRQLEDEIQARIAAQSQAKQERTAAATGIASTGVDTFLTRFQQEQTIQGRAPSASEITALAKAYNVDEATAAGLISFIGKNPEAATSISKYLGLAKNAEGGK